MNVGKNSNEVPPEVEGMKAAVLETPINRVPTGPSRSENETWTREFMGETAFLTNLCQERTRAERSGRKFALMLVDGGHTLAFGKEFVTIRKFTSALLNCTRKIDVVGWYETNSIAGILLTEFGEGNPQDALRLVDMRVREILTNELPILAQNRLRISFHIFPEEWNFEDPYFAPDKKLHPDLPAQERSDRAKRVVKRAIDVAGSAFALIALAPIFLVIAALIKLTSKGPVFFRQQRIGQYGVPFTFLKFRSMHTQAKTDLHEEYVKKFISGSANSADNDGLFKMKNDPRVTQIGKFLRKTSLDELPQFINVLRGEMSLVGPRPPILYELKSYNQWHLRRVLVARPGITGLWQVNGRSRTRFDEMVRLDLRYAAEQSTWLDLQIMAKTPLAMLTDKETC
jgi:lipopolysaccharide/colanic/teichoic acid biosynthesis glycosyltransferase